MCTRSASVVALQPCEAFVVTRYELNRFLGSCPELRQRLLDLGRSYPSDQELLTAWRHDQAWADYRTNPNPNPNPNPNLNPNLNPNPNPNPNPHPNPNRNQAWADYRSQLLSEVRLRVRFRVRVRVRVRVALGLG